MCKFAFLKSETENKVNWDMQTLFMLVIGGIIMFVGPEDNSIFKGQMG